MLNRLYSDVIHSMSGQVEMPSDENVCVLLDGRAMSRQSRTDLLFCFANVLLIAFSAADKIYNISGGTREVTGANNWIPTVSQGASEETKGFNYRASSKASSVTFVD